MFSFLRRWLVKKQSALEKLAHFDRAAPDMRTGFIYLNGLLLFNLSFFFLDPYPNKYKTITLFQEAILLFLIKNCSQANLPRWILFDQLSKQKANRSNDILGGSWVSLVI